MPDSEITIVDYGLGNLASIQNMFSRVGSRTIITNSVEHVKNASKLILPGVGSFDKGMSNLKESGLLEALHQKVLIDKSPILGICLGMQLMTTSSEEGQLPGLGWVDAKTVRFKVSDKDKYKVPHMGWNHVYPSGSTSFAPNPDEIMRFYFVHSYHVELQDSSEQLFFSNFEEPFTSAFQKNNIIGVQFHPEKSHKQGMRFLRTFSEMPATI